MIKDIKIGDVVIKAGESKSLQLNVGKLYDSTDLSMPVSVIRGKKEGPIIFISAAIHGDEVNGVEIVREVMSVLSKKEIKGTVIAVPIVNVFGFNHLSRYLPDRKDLNRSFPGNTKGSLASRMANLFMKEIVSKCTHGIDFHTGAIHRSNHPQIRADLTNRKTLEFAKAFNAPIIVNSKTRDGSLREAARKKGVLTLLFEGGQALRFEKKIIKAGKEGCLNALRSIGVIPRLKNRKATSSSLITQSSTWIRSPMGGTLRLKIKDGSYIRENEKIGEIVDPFGRNKMIIFSSESGYVIGINRLPLVTIGEAIVHIATSKARKNALTDNLYDDLG